MKVAPKKALGQHFLIDAGISRRIAESLTHHGGYTKLLEIGPGTGALTVHLLDVYKPENVFVVEIDRESVAYLTTKGIVAADKIIGADFLKTDVSAELGDCFAVIGNFPYNISTQILFRVFDMRDKVPELVGMFQKEVAERVASGPGNKDYGILSVLLQVFYDIEYLFTVPAEAFDPPPKVLSGVIRMKRNNVVDPGCDLPAFIKVVKTGFNQRRKMLRGSLKSILPPGVSVPEEFGTLRPEQLSPAQFIALTNLLFPR